MDTSKGDEDGPPCPNPKPRSNCPPVVKRKISPPLPAKPQPPLPKRPPVASKPTTSSANAVHSEAGSLTFPKKAPPLPSVPPCAEIRNDHARPVPNPRRISYIIATSPENSELLSDVCQNVVVEGVPLVQSAETRNKGHMTVKMPGRSPVEEMQGKNMAAGQSRPKPMVKPKPKIKPKPSGPKVKDISKPHTPESKDEAIRQCESMVVNAGVCDNIKSPDEFVQDIVTVEDVEDESQRNAVLSEERVNVSGNIKIEASLHPDKYSKDEQEDITNTDDAAINIDSNDNINISDSKETPKRPPRKNRLSKSLSQVSFSVASNEELSLCASPNHGDDVKQQGRASLCASPNHSDDVKQQGTAFDVQDKPRQKLKPSRKAPPPPVHNMPVKPSVPLVDSGSTLATDQTDGAALGTNMTNTNDLTVNKEKTDLAQSNVFKGVEKQKSRDSSPQPGRLNIKGLEASMGLSIEKGLQHQMKAKARPKPKPKPPVLIRKPKLTQNQANDELDTSKTTRNPSYTHAIKSPPVEEINTKQCSKDMKENQKAITTKYKRTNSYAEALDDFEDDITERDLSAKGNSLQISHDSDIALQSGLDNLNKKEAMIPAIPGLGNILPTDLELARSQIKANKTVGESVLKQSGLIKENITNDSALRRSKTVEVLLDIKVPETGNESSPITTRRNESSPITTRRNESSPITTHKLKKAKSSDDILENKTGSFKHERPIFVPPPPPRNTELNMNKDIEQRSKSLQYPSSGEDGIKGPESSRSSNEIDDQVFLRQHSCDSSNSHDYEQIDLPGCLRIDESDSDDPDHIYEPIPFLPPKVGPRRQSEDIDVPPVRPPKRPKQHEPVPPTPPVLSPPTTPVSSSAPNISYTPPLPPRRRVLASNSTVQARTPSVMYDTEGYFQPVTPELCPKGDIYSYADVPNYPFEKKKTVKVLASPPPIPEPMPRAVESTPQSKRESALSIISDRTSGGSHIYEPIGLALNSITREKSSTNNQEQRTTSGNSIFYFGINAEDDAQIQASNDLNPDTLNNNNQLTAELESESIRDSADQRLDMAVPPPPHAPPRLKRLQPHDPSTDSSKLSTSSSSSDDYIYPDDPKMVPMENSTYKGGEHSESISNVLVEEEESLYHEPNENDEAIYHEPDENSDSISHKPDPNLEAIYHEPDEAICREATTEKDAGICHKFDETENSMDQVIYNEAEDSAVDCHSGSASEVASPTSPPPVPPRDHHRSEPVPHAIRQALNIQRTASALSDTKINLKKNKPKVIPKAVSFESQLTDSALSLSPVSEGRVSPPQEQVTNKRLKQKSISNPGMLSKRRADDSFQEDSTSNSSDRPSSWASSGDGFEEGTYTRRQRSYSDDTRSVASSMYPDSVLELHGYGSDRSDLSDTEEWEKEKSEKREKKILNVAREIMTTEETFVDILKLLNIDFRLAMAKATAEMDHAVVPPSVMNQILKYLPQIQNFAEELLADLKERINNWENNPRIADIFLRKGPFLKMYTFYIREFENCMAALDDARKKYPEFDIAMKDYEASPRCKHLLIRHYMLKPIQRIPQYKLLLQEYLKYLTVKHVDFKDTEAALVIVSAVADHANQSMKYSDNFKKLWEIQSALIGQFEVIHPGRSFIKEGMLHKLSRKVMQPRMFFLLSDVLLYTTPVSGGYKLNNHISLTGMRVILPTKEDFQNELSIISTERSFTVSAYTAAERDEWLTILRTTINENNKRISSFDVRKLHKVSSVLIEGDKDFPLGTRAAVWIPDARVSMCMLCTAEFGVTFRRHHCRACGKVVCGYCSDYRAPLRYLLYKAARVCSECYANLSKDFEKDNLPVLAESRSTFSRASIKTRFRGISWGSYRKANKAKRPAVLQEVMANDELVEMSGYLKVWKVRKWKKLWFVLKGKALYTFKASEDAAAIESIVLLGYEVQTFDSWFEGIEPTLVFEIRHPGTAPKILRTESPASRDKWLCAIREATMP